MGVVPRRIIVDKVLTSRSAAGARPLNWGKRYGGVDRVVTASGESLMLLSKGQQSTPAKGWELLLTHELPTPSGEPGYTWTLYGIKKLDPHSSDGLAA